ncbi:MAG: hypothetical protein LUC47_03295 [Clostridiales bacterium]|nr:hypothetical protein [Clostridiales bacterium]
MQNDTERQKILDTTNRYHSYFDEWDADIAIGRNGPNFFYVLNADTGSFDVFAPFETAEQLEALILGDIASNIGTYIYVGTESRLKAFNMDTVNDSYGNYHPEASVQSLFRQMEVLAADNARWSEFMAKTYRSLVGLGT